MSFFKQAFAVRGIRWAEHLEEGRVRTGMKPWASLDSRRKIARLQVGIPRLLSALRLELRSSARRICIAIARWIDPWDGIPGYLYQVDESPNHCLSETTILRNACMQAALSSWGELSPADALLVLEGWSLAVRFYVRNSGNAAIVSAQAWEKLTCTSQIHQYQNMVTDLLLIREESHA